MPKSNLTGTYTANRNHYYFHHTILSILSNHLLCTNHLLPFFFRLDYYFGMCLVIFNHLNQSSHLFVPWFYSKQANTKMKKLFMLFLSLFCVGASGDFKNDSLPVQELLDLKLLGAVGEVEGFSAVRPN